MQKGYINIIKKTIRDAFEKNENLNYDMNKY